MKYYPHVIFRKSQFSVEFELPNDVLFDLQSLLKQVNKSLVNGYRITGDDLICLALEDFNERYIGEAEALIKRLGT